MSKRRMHRVIAFGGLGAAALLALAVLGGAGRDPGPEPGQLFIAYSLRQAQHQLQAPDEASPEVMLLGGMTRVAGLVYDGQNDDPVLVGQVVQGGRKITLDDLVVALRAPLVHEQWPAVSIDKTPKTQATGKQTVRFEGGIEGTAFGRDFLAADVCLKKIALELLPGRPGGVGSYFALSADAANRGDTQQIGSRFWFYPLRAPMVTREGVFAITDLQIGVLTQVMSVNGEPPSRHPDVRDEVGDDFSQQFTANIDAVAREYPEVARLSELFGLAAVAKGLESLEPQPDLDYWLSDYQIAPIETLAEFPLLKQSAPVSVAGRATTMVIEGGVKIDPLAMRLEDGDVTALRDIVLQTRPSPTTLVWRVPLGRWEMPEGLGEGASDDVAAEIIAEESVSREAPACDLERRVGPPPNWPDGGGGGAAAYGPGRPLNNRQPDIAGTGKLPTSIDHSPYLSPRHASPILSPPPTFEQTRSPQIATPDAGGVLLRADPEAKLSTIQGATWDAKGNRFGLVVASGSAELPLELADDWRAILLTVYGGEDPGISLDPGPTRNIMLVRSIGRVRGTRLGAVMLEADRLLKCYTLGRDNRTGEGIDPRIKGYKPIDEILKEVGLQYNGVMSRMWFVPEPVPISEERGRLCFGDVAIKAKTEYAVEGLRGECEPADKRFAQFFTTNYDKFAEIHPEFRELKEYAKLVALAKYVRRQGIPLNWLIFALPKPDRPAEMPSTEMGYTIGGEETGGLEIWGGVDLAGNARTEYDFAAMPAATRDLLAMEARAAALQQDSTAPMAPGKLPAVQSDVSGQTQTLVDFPARLRTADGDVVEITTDAAIADARGPVLQLTRVRGVRGGDEFGGGWSLFVPYRLVTSGRTREVAGHTLPASVTVSEQLTEESHSLGLSEDDEGTVCYRSDGCWWIHGVYPKTDGWWALEDYWGNRFTFDGSLRPVMVDLGRDNRWAYEWDDRGRIAGLCALPYSIVLGEATADTPSGLAPGKVTVEDRKGTHVLTFAGVAQGEATYGAKAGPWQAFSIALDGGALSLVDRSGRTLRYSGDGCVMAVERRPPSAAAGGGYWDIALEYDEAGRVMVAALSGEGDVYYIHTDRGALRAVVDSHGWPTYYETPRPTRGPGIAGAAMVCAVVVLVVAGGATCVRKRRRGHPGPPNPPGSATDEVAS
jgi:hypothetical protein